MKPFEAPAWTVVRFADDVVRTSVTLPIDWFGSRSLDPDPPQPK